MLCALEPAGHQDEEGLTAPRPCYQRHNARCVDDPAPVAALMGLLGQHLLEGGFAPEEHGLDVDLHRLVPGVLLCFVYHSRRGRLAAYTCIIHHASVCISAFEPSPFTLFHPSLSAMLALVYLHV